MVGIFSIALVISAATSAEAQDVNVEFLRKIMTSTHPLARVVKEFDQCTLLKPSSPLTDRENYPGEGRVGTITVPRKTSEAVSVENGGQFCRVPSSHAQPIDVSASDQAYSIAYSRNEFAKLSLDIENF